MLIDWLTAADGFVLNAGLAEGLVDVDGTLDSEGYNGNRNVKQ